MDIMKKYFTFLKEGAGDLMYIALIGNAIQLTQDIGAATLFDRGDVEVFCTEGEFNHNISNYIVEPMRDNPNSVYIKTTSLEGVIYNKYDKRVFKAYRDLSDMRKNGEL